MNRPDFLKNDLATGATVVGGGGFIGLLRSAPEAQAVPFRPPRALDKAGALPPYRAYPGDAADQLIRAAVLGKQPQGPQSQAAGMVTIGG